MKISELPYHRNSAELFEVLAGEEWSVFLDSGYPNIDSGRFDILSGRPFRTFVTRGRETVVTEMGGETSVSLDDPFDLVRLNLESTQRGKDMAQGTGLGLNITKNLIERHDGTIWVESDVGQGTTFHYAIPLAPEEAAVPTDQ